MTKQPKLTAAKARAISALVALMETGEMLAEQPLPPLVRAPPAPVAQERHVAQEVVPRP